MGMHQVRNARGQKLYQGRPKFAVSKGQNGSIRETFAGTTGQADTSTYTRPFKTYPNTPNPKAAEDVDHGIEGPPASRRSRRQ